MLIAASALGYAAQWLTEWCAYDLSVHKLLGMDTEEAVAGFVYLGSTDELPLERKRPVLEEHVTYWLPE